MIKALLFDKDGTLFDFAATWEAWAHSFLTRLGKGDADRTALLGQQIGFDVRTQTFCADSIAIAGTPGEIVEALAPQVSEMTKAELLQLLNYEAENAPQAEAVPLIALLEVFKTRGLTLGVATNDAEAPARAHLGEAGVTGYFAFIAGFDSGYGAKPTSGQLLAFAKAVGLAPSEVAMIGDSLHDMAAGRAAGMACVAVLTGMATRQDLEAAADVVLPDIGHLPAWLDSRSQ
jgi:phosphoglycolate phosphatase